MGFRFDLQSLNWLAYLIDETRPMPRLADPVEERDLLRAFLLKLRTQFVSSHTREDQVSREAEFALRQLERFWSGTLPRDFLHELRDRLRIGAGPWAAMIVPSRTDLRINNFLCSQRLLISLVRDEQWPDGGILLQPEGDCIDDTNAIIDVFPAFRYALAAGTEWPGMLFWTKSGDATFLPFRTDSPSEIRTRIGWMLSFLAAQRGKSLKQLQKQYTREFEGARHAGSRIVTLLHISDLHIGSEEASTRLGRLQQMIRGVLEELPAGGRVVPVVTGDIMDDPNPRAYDEADRFLDFLHNLNTDEPVLVLGNHDVRRGGYLETDLSEALRFRNEGVRWLDRERIGIACFNSNLEANSDLDLATGKIGERQFQAMGNAIDRKRDSNDYLMVALLHHHPVPVPRPSWYPVSLAEKIFGRLIARTVELRDASAFKRFVRDRRFTAVLHGHEHIPRFDKIDAATGEDIAIIGCGSSVGKVPTNNDEVFASLNLISINRTTRQMTARLAAQTISGGKLKTTHEYVCQI